MQICDVEVRYVIHNCREIHLWNMFEDCCDVFPDCRFSDGDFQLLPEYRYGEQGYLSLYFPSGACTDSLPVDSSPVLRAARRVDQYAYL